VSRSAAATVDLIAIDVRRCCGAGMCALIAPEVFDQDPESGTVVLLDSRPERYDLVRDAVVSCPSGAISLTEP